VVFAIPVQAFWRIRASRYKLTDGLISCHVAEFLKRASARSAYKVNGLLSRYQKQKAKTMTSLCTLLSVLAVGLFKDYQEIQNLFYMILFLLQFLILW
jgi:hypothetical protein